MPLEKARTPDIYMHPAALENKYAREDNPPHRSIGIPSLGGNGIRSRAINPIRTRTPMEIVRGIFVTGEISRHTDFEDVGGPFYL